MVLMACGLCCSNKYPRWILKPTILAIFGRFGALWGSLSTSMSLKPKPQAAQPLRLWVCTVCLYGCMCVLMCCVAAYVWESSNLVWGFWGFPVVELIRLEDDCGWGGGTICDCSCRQCLPGNRYRDEVCFNMSECAYKTCRSDVLDNKDVVTIIIVPAINTTYYAYQNTFSYHNQSVAP